MIGFTFEEAANQEIGLKNARHAPAYIWKGQRQIESRHTQPLVGLLLTSSDIKGAEREFIKDSVEFLHSVVHLCGTFFVDYRGFHAFANRQAVRRRGTTAMSCKWSRLEQEDLSGNGHNSTTPLSATMVYPTVLALSQSDA